MANNTITIKLDVTELVAELQALRASVDELARLQRAANRQTADGDALAVVSVLERVTSESAR